ncbi:LysR family transcriptional regulator [Octadecabacter sp. 1_MG-2023]|uniref:LysR family transcriptional regulator n=1 Tax=unclassified Octadecabacter TaxID=196158 RepID=UPI0020913F22|nr:MULTISPECIES: LysR family transcriptional regulator [unclassified Octadecabacter]MDO6734838.1 LysR family transcriptional regulator [Octadecabacter sp. 1_MG-2023]
MNSLRAFEAAARLCSFSAAADELGVTAGAISQHIRTLENWTETPLFERRAQGVVLTSEGRRLLPDFTQAFDAMGQAVRGLRGLSKDRTVSIAALPSVAQLWLQPRLGLLRAALPGVSVSVAALETPPNLDRELFDLTFYMRDPADCTNGITLARDTLAPVCSPTLAARLSQPRDLEDETLLHDEVWAADWSVWANATGTPLSRLDAGPRFSLYAMAVAEAKEGAGVLIGHSALITAALDSGELVQPFGQSVASPFCLVAEVADGPEADAIRAALGSLTV